MPAFDPDQVALDNTVENRRLGSIMLTLGWILLWVDVVLAAMFFFISVRNGSLFWPIWLTVQGLLGVVLVFAGTRYRRTIGASRLGRRDIARTLRQQQKEDQEHNRVA